MILRAVKTKLYCYVDESGQETQGRLFIVAVVIVGVERETAREVLKQIEAESGKGHKKWTKATRQQRRNYLEALAKLKAWPGTIYCLDFERTTDYQAATIQAIAQAIRATVDESPYRATVLVDGLGKAERRRIANGLRDQQINADKVRGLRDESDEFIRLADAAAGLVRDYREGQAYITPVFERLKARGLIKELR